MPELIYIIAAGLMFLVIVLILTDIKEHLWRIESHLMEDDDG